MGFRLRAAIHVALGNRQAACATISARVVWIGLAFKEQVGRYEVFQNRLQAVVVGFACAGDGADLLGVVDGHQSPQRVGREVLDEGLSEHRDVAFYGTGHSLS